MAEILDVKQEEIMPQGSGEDVQEQIVEDNEPPQQDPPTKELYNKLSSKEYGELYTNSYDQFVKDYGTKEGAKELHGLLSSPDYEFYTDTEDKFINDYFPQLKSEQKQVEAIKYNGEVIPSEELPTSYVVTQAKTNPITLISKKKELKQRLSVNPQDKEAESQILSIDAKLKSVFNMSEDAQNAFANKLEGLSPSEERNRLYHYSGEELVPQLAYTDASLWKEYQSNPKYFEYLINNEKVQNTLRRYDKKANNEFSKQSENFNKYHYSEKDNPDNIYYNAQRELEVSNNQSNIIANSEKLKENDDMRQKAMTYHRQASDWYVRNHFKTFDRASQYLTTKLKVDEGIKKGDEEDIKKISAIVSEGKAKIDDISLDKIEKIVDPRNPYDVRAFEVYKQQRLENEKQYAIDATTERALKNKGIVAAKGTPAYLSERAKISTALQDGNAVITTNPITGKPDLAQGLGFIGALADGWNKAWESEDDAYAWSDMTTQQKVEYANKITAKVTKEGYMGQAPSGALGAAGEIIGGAGPFIGKTIAATTIATGLAIAAPESGGASLAGIPIALEALPTVAAFAATTPAMVYQGAMNRQMQAFMKLREQNPDANEEDLMKQAESSATLGAIEGGLTNLAFTGIGAAPLTRPGALTNIGANVISNESKSALKNIVGKIVNTSLKVGKETIGAGAKMAAIVAPVETTTSIVQGVVDKRLKEKPKEYVKELWNSGVDNFKNGMLLHFATMTAAGALKLPVTVNNLIKDLTLKEYKSNPAEINQVLDGNVELGNITQEVADKVKTELQEHKNASDKVPESTKQQSPEVATTLTGLIEKKNKLMEQMSSVDDSQMQPIQEEVNSVNKRIEELNATGNVDKVEYNSVGESLSTTGVGEEVAQGLPEGKIQNTDYEIRQDGVYYQGIKMGNPENKSPIELIKADLKGKLDFDLSKTNDPAEKLKLDTKYQDELKSIEDYDKENAARISSQVGVGEELIQAQPIESGSVQEISGGGIIQKEGEEGQIETIDQTEVIRQMKPITDKMAEVEREFENNGLSIDTDYDNEIIITDKDGEIIDTEDVPDNLIQLATDYENATRRLGEFDSSAREKALAESRKIEEVVAEEVKPSELPKAEEKPKIFSIDNKEDFYHGSYNKREGRLRTNTAEQFGDAIYFTTSKEEAEGGYPHVTKVKLNIENPIYAGEGKWNEVEKLALEKENANKERDEDGNIIGEVLDLADIENSNNISDAAKELGYDAIILRGQGNHENETAVLNPSKVIYPEDVAEKQAELPKAKEKPSEVGDFKNIKLEMRYPERNEVIYVSPERLLDQHAKDNPDFDVQKKENQIGNRVEKAKQFLTDYLKDPRLINRKTGERMNIEAIFEPSVVSIGDNGKLGFEDGRHRVLAAKELGIDKIPIEVPKEQAERLRNELREPIREEVSGAVQPTPEVPQEQKAEARVQPSAERVSDGKAETTASVLEQEQTRETDLLLSGEAEKRRKEGKFVKDGIEFKRNEKGGGVASEKGGEVRFTSEPGGGGVVVPFKYKLVEAETLQPSHQDGIRNPLHFIPEAQPKNRNDIGTLQAEESFANNPRFNELGARTDAYGGAPVVNERGEVIQGNNRSAGLRKGYQRGNKIYKQALAENAEQFGFNKEQVEGMKNPVLVREVAASDQGAIELGNYDVKDLETGGKRRLDPVAITRRMPFNIKGKISDILFKGEETLNQAIRTNIKRLMEYLDPYLNQSQRNTIFKNNELTDAGIKDLESVVQQFLFDGGDVALPELYENLSHTQKEGLRKALPYIFSTSAEKSITPEIQEAILALNDFGASKSGNFDAWLAQSDMFNNGMTPREKYSPTAIKIAEILETSKSQKEIASQFGKYAEAVNDRPATMFEEAVKGAAKKEGIKEVFKTEYDESKKPEISPRGTEETPAKEEPKPQPIAEEPKPTAEPAGAKPAKPIKPTESTAEPKPIKREGEPTREEVSGAVQAVSELPKEQKVEGGLQPSTEPISKGKTETTTPVLEGGEEVPKAEKKLSKKAPGKYEAKMIEFGKKIDEVKVLPDFIGNLLKAELPEGTKISGVSEQEVKELLKDALVTMGKLIDKGVEFSDALKTSVKNIVKTLGEENRDNIEKGFEKYYRENAGEGVPPKQDLPEMKTGEGELMGIRMVDNAERRKQIGMPERQPNPESVEQWRAEAQAEIAKGYNVNKLIGKMESGDVLSPVENEISRIFAATFDNEVKKNPTNENISAYERFIKARENASRKIGQSLRSLQGVSNPLENISDFFVATKEALKVDELTENQIAEVKKDFEKIQASKEEYRKKLEDAEAKLSELKAQNELLQKQKEKKEKKIFTPEGKRDFKAERENLKQKLKDAIEKYKNNANNLGISSDGGAENFAISVDMAKIISSIAKNHVEEVGAKLAEVTRRTLEDVKDLFDGITEKDIRDVIAGKYSERKETKSELQANINQIRSEAKLLNELDRVLASEPKTEQQRIERNQELASLRKQINEVKKKNGLDEYSEEARTEKAIKAAEENIKELEDKLSKNELDVQRAEKLNSPELDGLRERQKELRDELDAKRKEAKVGKYSEEARIKNAIEANKRKEKELQERLANGDFEPQSKRQSVYESPEFKSKYPKLYKELLDSRVAKEKAELEFHKKLVEEEMKSMGKIDKFKQILIKARGTLKAFFAGIDDSAVGVQNWMQSIVNPVIGIKAIRNHIVDFWSEKAFERRIAELHESADYPIMRDSGLSIYEPESLVEKAKDEFFPSRFKAIIKLNEKEYGWINIGGKKYELFDVLKPFERAFTSLGNSLRVIKFRTEAEKMYEKGITFEKNPDQFKALASRINATTSASEPSKAFKSDIVNFAVWSPRLMSSKLNILGISDLASFTPLVEKGYYRGLGEKGKILSKQQLYAVGDLAKFATSIVAGSYLFAAARGGKLNLNPFDDDFMDIELPNGKSYNLSGGYSKYIATLFQAISGGEVSRLTGKYQKYSGFKDRGAEILHFMRGKMPPVSGAVVNLAVGKDYTGKETSLSSEAERFKMPMAISQISKQIHNDGYSALYGDAIPTFLGINVKDSRDYSKPKVLFEKSEFNSPEMKILLDKDIVPQIRKKEQYKVSVDIKHPDGLMTDEEYDIFVDLTKKYIKNGFYKKNKDGDKIKVNSIKDILNTKYSVENVINGRVVKRKTVLGKDLDKDKLSNKISSLKEDAINKAKSDMGFKEEKTVVKKKD